MTTWQKLGDPNRPLYCGIFDPEAMLFGVKRIDVMYFDVRCIDKMYSEKGTPAIAAKTRCDVNCIDVTYSEDGPIIITVETEEGAMVVKLHRRNR